MQGISRRNLIGLAAKSAVVASTAAFFSQAAIALADEEKGEFTWTTEDLYLDYGDYKTYCIVRKPDIAEGEKCPMALMAHGYGGSSQSDVHIAICEALAKRGVATLQINYTSNGGSDLPFVEHSVLTDVDRALIAIDYIRSLDYVSKVGMIGHSQGGCGTCLTSAKLEESDQQLDFAILLAPANMIPDVARKGGYEACDDWYAGMGMWFDPEEKHERDDLMDLGSWGAVNYSYFEDAAGIDMWETCKQVTCPTLLLWGTADAPVALNYVVRTQENIPTCIFHAFEGEGHGFNTRTDDVIAQINKFLDAQLA